MPDQAVITYCVCDEVCKALNVKDDPQCKMSSAEIITFAILAASLFGCDYKRARLMLGGFRSYFKKILSHSQIVRRIHAIPEQVWIMVFLSLRLLSHDEAKKIFIVDSFPIKAYENHKSFRARIFKGKRFHGYSCSRKQYFFGIKVHMVVDQDGVPIEFSFTPGSNSDIKAFRELNLDLPNGSLLFGDRAYTDYGFEDALYQIENIKLIARRKTNSKRKHSPSEEYCLNTIRNRVETAFSSITGRMPRHMKVRTEKGLYLKVTFFILAYMVQLYYPLG